MLCCALSWFGIGRFIYGPQCNFTGTKALARLTRYQWSNIETLQWRHNEHHGISNHRRFDCLRVTGLCEGNSSVSGDFPAQRTDNAANVSIWWCHHEDNGLHATWIQMNWLHNHNKSLGTTKPHILWDNVYVTEILRVDCYVNCMAQQWYISVNFDTCKLEHLIIRYCSQHRTIWSSGASFTYKD